MLAWPCGQCCEAAGVGSRPATPHGPPGTELATPCQAASSTRASACYRDKGKNCVLREDPKKGRQEEGGKEMEGKWRGLERDRYEMKGPKCSGLYLGGQGCQEAQGRLTSALTPTRLGPAGAADFNPCPQKQAGSQCQRKGRAKRQAGISLKWIHHWPSMPQTD